MRRTKNCERVYAFLESEGRFDGLVTNETKYRNDEVLP